MPAYDYDNFREKLFTDKGQRLVMAVRDIAREMIDHAGAARAARVHMKVASGKLGAVDLAEAVAALDRLVEMGELKLLFEPIGISYRIYVDQKEADRDNRREG